MIWLVLGGTGGIGAFWLSRTLGGSRVPVAVNVRGTRVPVILGMAVAASVTGVVGTAALGFFPGRRWLPAARTPWLLAAALLVFAGGLYDDYHAGPDRGLLAHASALLEGKATTGIVKLGVAISAAVVVCAVAGFPWPRWVLGVPLMAGAANLWNLLDVAPGRALKYFLLGGAVFVALGVRYPFGNSILPAAIGASVGVFPADVRERGMLGDGGANLLGFVLGMALVRSHASVFVLAIALGAVLLLHVVAETVTLTRVIGAAPLLRWFDGLGRLPADASGPES